jgi:hypothetical protein
MSHPTINEEYYEGLDREALLEEIERLTNTTRKLSRDLNTEKSKRQDTYTHLKECLEFIRKHEQKLTDAGVAPEEFLRIEIPF